MRSNHRRASGGQQAHRNAEHQGEQQRRQCEDGRAGKGFRNERGDRLLPDKTFAKGRPAQPPTLLGPAQRAQPAEGVDVALMPRLVETEPGAHVRDQFRVSLLARQLTGRIGNRRENQEHQGEAAPQDRQAPKDLPCRHCPAVHHQRPARASSQLAGTSRHAHLFCTMPSFNRTTPGLLRR